MQPWGKKSLKAGFAFAILGNGKVLRSGKREKGEGRDGVNR